MLRLPFRMEDRMPWFTDEDDVSTKTINL